jgi:hypothetical protein
MLVPEALQIQPARDPNWARTRRWMRIRRRPSTVRPTSSSPSRRPAPGDGADPKSHCQKMPTSSTISSDPRRSRSVRTESSGERARGSDQRRHDSDGGSMTSSELERQAPTCGQHADREVLDDPRHRPHRSAAHGPARLERGSRPRHAVVRTHPYRGDAPRAGSREDHCLSPPRRRRRLQVLSATTQDDAERPTSRSQRGVPMDQTRIRSPSPRPPCSRPCR